MRGVFLTCAFVGLGACAAESTAFIPGSAQLPGCTDTPVTDLNGTEWFDTGTLTIGSAGCPGTATGDVLATCSLNWDFVQRGNEVEIVVDDEYRLEGRLCGDELSLRGGWWLPVEDAGQCTYDDDSAEEMGIQAAGNVLAVEAQKMTGTLSVRGGCDGTYQITLAPTPDMGTGP